MRKILCPYGHKDTYLVKDKEIIKEHGLLLACNTCEDFHEVEVVRKENE